MERHRAPLVHESSREGPVSIENWRDPIIRPILGAIDAAAGIALAKIEKEKAKISQFANAEGLKCEADMLRLEAESAASKLRQDRLRSEADQREMAMAAAAREQEDALARECAEEEEAERRRAESALLFFYEGLLRTEADKVRQLEGLVATEGSKVRQLESRLAQEEAERAYLGPQSVSQEGPPPLEGMVSNLASPIQNGAIRPSLKLDPLTRDTPKLLDEMDGLSIQLVPSRVGNGMRERSLQPAEERRLTAKAMEVYSMMMHTNLVKSMRQWLEATRLCRDQLHLVKSALSHYQDRDLRGILVHWRESTDETIMDKAVLRRGILCMRNRALAAATKTWWARIEEEKRRWERKKDRALMRKQWHVVKANLRAGQMSAGDAEAHSHAAKIRAQIADQISTEMKSKLTEVKVAASIAEGPKEKAAAETEIAQAKAKLTAYAKVGQAQLQFSKVAADHAQLTEKLNHSTDFCHEEWKSIAFRRLEVIEGLLKVREATAAVSETAKSALVVLSQTHDNEGHTADDMVLLSYSDAWMSAKHKLIEATRSRAKVARLQIEAEAMQHGEDKAEMVTKMEILAAESLAKEAQCEQEVAEADADCAKMALDSRIEKSESLKADIEGSLGGGGVKG